jgi:hypothetical protein
VVGDVYAFRTFVIAKDKLVSIGFGQGTADDDDEDGGKWVNGMIEARCLVNDDHVAPVRDCSCGVYGFYDIEHLATQYPEPVKRIVAVIAIGGRVLVDEKGLRATRARVVAYWCAEGADDEGAVCAADCPDTRRFRDRGLMALFYGMTGQPPV